jgi:MoaA/NifB/PqqE/SkfB family radical SAM enzyme
MNVEESESLKKFQDSLLRSNTFKNVRRIAVTGSGDPFASKVFMDLLNKIDKNRYPNLKISLRTNGVLLTPSKWELLDNVHYAIDSISISIDAATEKTYRTLRRGGDFHKLMSNLRFLKKLKRNKRIKVGVNFVAQLANYKEMPRFVKLAKTFDCDEVAFTQLMNRGTYSPAEYLKAAVHKPTHEQHQHLIKIINKSIFRDPIVSLGNLSNLIRGN